VAALDARDKETEGHSRRVVAFTLALADQLDIPDEELTTIWLRATIDFHPSPQGRLTASLGVVYCDGAREIISPDSLIAMADQALYQAKTAGRNRIKFWEQS